MSQFNLIFFEKFCSNELKSHENVALNGVAPVIALDQINVLDM